MQRGPFEKRSYHFYEIIMNNDKCPHCRQIMKVYARNLRKSHLKILRELVINGENKFALLSYKLEMSVSDASTILQMFGLVEPGEKKYTWKASDLGKDFLMGLVSVPKYRFYYNNVQQETPEDYMARQRQVFVYDIYPELIDKESAMRNSRSLHRKIDGQQVTFF